MIIFQAAGVILALAAVAYTIALISLLILGFAWPVIRTIWRLSCFTLSSTRRRGSPSRSEQSSSRDFMRSLSRGPNPYR